MQLRELTGDDREAAIALWRDAGLARPWNDLASDFDRAVGGPTSAVLGAFGASGLAATAMVGYDGHRAGCTTWP